MTILLDFETRSRCGLKARGGRNYAADPTTEVLCCVLYDTESESVDAWAPGDPPLLLSANPTLAAHNASGFDRFVWERLGWAEGHDYVDTSELARRAGLPGALDALGTRWLGLPKDTEGSRFTKSLSRPSRAKKTLGQLPPITPEVRRRVLAYCTSDVEIMAYGWDQLRPYHEDGVFSGWERDVLTVDRIVNDRGIAFDSDLAERLLIRDETLKGEAIQRAATACGWSFDGTADVVGSPAQLAEMLGLENAQADTIVEALKSGTWGERWQVALAEARQALATIAAGKLEAGLARVSPDGRLRDMHCYYGAHTGRWSGKGMQLQNIPRPDKVHETWKDDDICAVCDDVSRASAATITSVLLRGTLYGSEGALAVCDFSGVEARALAYCAGDRKAIDVFLAYDAGKGPDPYKVAAGVIFGVDPTMVDKVQRGVGKVAELACGYGMGAAKFYANNDAALDAAGVDAQDVVDAWRKQHAPIVRYWREFERAFVAAARGEQVDVWPFSFVPSSSGNDVAIFLPSGRPIVYLDVGLETGAYGYSPYYVGGRGRDHLYGGKIAENVIQAMCRDLMADALVRCEKAGLNPVLHVHDEIVCDVPESCAQEALAELRQIMMTLPEWAEGFPIGAAGHTGRRYRK